MTPAEFVRHVQGTKARIRQLHTEGVRELSRIAFVRLVETSPVLTGQYRASHRVGIGKADESFAAKPESGVLSAPELGGIEALLARLKFGQSVLHSNSVEHAKYLEFGTALMDPRRIYELGSMVVEQAAERLARAMRFEGGANALGA